MLLAFLMAAQPLPALPPCIAVDGDTLRCGSERIRLNGIDAPELPGHCRKGRSCAPGDPLASQRALANRIAGQRLIIRRWGTDHYGRTIASVYISPFVPSRRGRAAPFVPSSRGRTAEQSREQSRERSDLSCLQWRTGFAVRVARWDHANLSATCPKPRSP